MGHSKEELLRRQREVVIIGKFFLEEGSENFREIIKLCSRLNEQIEETAERAGVKAIAVKKFLTSLKDYNQLLNLTQ